MGRDTGQKPFDQGNDQVFSDVDDDIATSSSVSADGAPGSDQVAWAPSDGRRLRSGKSKAVVFIVCIVVVVALVVTANPLIRTITSSLQGSSQLRHIANPDTHHKDPVPVDKVSKGIEDIHDDHRHLVYSLESLATGSQTGDKDIAKLTSLIDKTDKDNAAFASLPIMNNAEVKRQLDRYTKATQADKTILNDFVGKAKALSAVNKACGESWTYIFGGESEKQSYDKHSASCTAALQPLSGSDDEAMKTFVSSVTGALEESGKAAGQLAVLHASATNDRSVEQQEDQLNKSIDISTRVQDYSYRYSWALQKKRDALHLDWAFDRAYDVAQSQKSAEDWEKSVHEGFPKGPGKAFKGDTAKKITDAMAEVAKRWSLMDSTVYDRSFKGMGNLEQADIDDINDVISTADKANQTLADQLSASGNGDYRPFKDFVTAYDKEKVTVGAYIPTMLPVSQAKSVCVTFPQLDESDPTYATYIGALDSCRAVLKPLDNPQDQRLHRLVTKMTANLDKNGSVIDKMKAFGSYHDAEAGKQSKAYEQLGHQLTYDQVGERERIFDEYTHAFANSRTQSGASGALYQLQGGGYGDD
ncbi:hypothetical protein [Bifidobacterium sp. ESL0745]|uniref:hypothetical protein n=1 Tax=Bifidobacterium sp. ESL0745 TaxID=2983226 RepID=UPI0023F991D1|nr:hypothetical protein [Bifidobacterium sp. ESL0745]MDF7665179.1 hypothetical protein [Bifidobacterium sp. ESL0745]